MVRAGIILAVTGIIALAHYFSGVVGVLPRRSELVTALALIVGGVALFIVAVLR